MENNQPTSEGFGSKFRLLRDQLQKYSKVAVAFSGGVDSTVLLDNCCKVFKPEDIVALHARSCLQAARTVESIEEVMAAHFSHTCIFRIVACDPLEWPDFVSNTDERCYFCKKKTYAILLEEAQKEGCKVLFDGTNTDDLSEYRPGLKAVKEHGVVSPFVLAGISKTDIRRYARGEGLVNHDLPSNSCLATRITTDQQITMELLAIIEDAENFMLSLGFAGVRVRPEKKRVFIELQEADIMRIVEVQKREEVIRYFKKQGLGQTFIGLAGR